MTFKPDVLVSRWYPNLRSRWSYDRLAVWLALAAVLPLALLIYGVKFMRQASVESGDVNYAGSLRFRSLLLYGMTNQGAARGDWRSGLVKMASIRENLRLRYPGAVRQTDDAWGTFSVSLERSGRVDWQTALRMRDAADRLTLSIEGAARERHSRATVLFIAGVAVTTAVAGLALVAARSRRRSDTARAAAEERFRVLFEQSSDAHLLFNHNGILDCNNAAAQMLGYRDKSAVLELHPAVLSPEFQPDGRRSLEKCVDMDALAREHGCHRFEWLHQKMDGRVFPVEVTLTPVTVGGTDTLLVVWHDLTERKAMEEDLRQSEARFHAFLNQGSMMGWITDTDGRIEYMNEPYCAMIGRSLDACLGKTPFDLFPDDVAQVMLDNIRLVAQSGETLETVECAPLPDGKLHHFVVHKFLLRDLNGRVLVGGSALDITEGKAAEQAVRKTQASLNLAQALAHVGSWERDYRDGTMTWSDETYRLCGLEPGSAAPSLEALFAYTHPLDQERALESMKQAMQSGLGAELDVRLVGADGVLRHVSIRTEILKDETGRHIGSRGTFSDVTDRVSAMQEQAKFVSLVENSSDFIAMATLDGELLTLNPAGHRLLGWEPDGNAATTMLSDIMPRDVWGWMREGVLPMVLRDNRWEGECQLIHLETGKVHDMQASFFLIRDPRSEEPMCLATVQRDITEQKWLDAQLQQNVVLVQEQNALLEWQRQELASANAHLKALATTDGLTGAKNHRAFQERLTEEFKRSDRTHNAFSLVLLDVDKFKQFNDSYGHPEGDRVLKQVVQILQEAARQTDYVARYGGEEFVVLLPETGVEGAVETAERFRAAIEAGDWPLRQVTASFGVATVSAAAQTEQHLVDMADKALYASKAAGRNRVTHMDKIRVTA